MDRRRRVIRKPADPWFGWYGFNAGSEFQVDSVTTSAFINTDVAASFAAATWLVVTWPPKEGIRMVLLRWSLDRSLSDILGVSHFLQGMNRFRGVLTRWASQQVSLR